MDLFAMFAQSPLLILEYDRQRRTSIVRQSWAYGFLTLLCISGMFLLIRYARSFSCSRCTVVNTSEMQLIESRGNGIRQDPGVPGLVRFRSHISGLLRPGAPTVETIATLMHWARNQQSQDPRLWQFDPSVDSGDVDPGVLLEQQSKLTPGACRRFSYVLAGALLSAGTPARVVALQAYLGDGLGHIMVEAWLDDMKQWVLVDPTSDSMFQIDGRYASLLQLRQVLQTGETKRIRFERHGSDLDPGPSMAYFQQIARHAFFFTNEMIFRDPPLTKASVWGFRVLHYVDEEADPYPEVTKKASLAAGAMLGLSGVLLFFALLRSLRDYLLQ